jgi:hypothetical protein
LSEAAAAAASLKPSPFPEDPDRDCTLAALAMDSCFALSIPLLPPGGIPLLPLVDAPFPARPLMMSEWVKKYFNIQKKGSLISQLIP